MNTSFERSEKYKDEWLTPPELLKKLGDFELDPCSPINRPWDTAKHHFTINDMSLLRDWFGRVWLNPPYGNNTEVWLEKLRLHGNGIALIFARTDTAYFQEYVFRSADAILFLKGRIIFHNSDGTKAKSNAGAPSCLIAYGQYNVNALAESGIDGYLIEIAKIIN